MTPSYLLIVCDLDKPFTIANAKTKYITSEDYSLLKEPWTKEVWLDEILYTIEARRPFARPFMTGFVYFLLLDVKRKM